MSIKSMYDLMRDILHESDAQRARRTIMDVDETPDHIMMWLDENVPLEYKDPEDLHRAYAPVTVGHLPFPGHYGANTTVSGPMPTTTMSLGVSSAKSRPSRGWVQYRFPSYIMKMSRSKAFAVHEIRHSPARSPSTLTPPPAGRPRTCCRT